MSDYRITDHARLAAENAELKENLARANRIIGWMSPYIGSMCPPDGGLGDLNEHFCANKIPEPTEETKGRPINQRPDLPARRWSSAGRSNHG